MSSEFRGSIDSNWPSEKEIDKGVKDNTPLISEEKRLVEENWPNDDDIYLDELDPYVIEEFRAQKSWEDIKQKGIKMENEHRAFLERLKNKYKEGEKQQAEIATKSIVSDASSNKNMIKFKYGIAIINRLLNDDGFISSDGLEALERELDPDKNGLIGGSDFRYFVDQCMVMKIYAEGGEELMAKLKRQVEENKE